MSTPPFALSSDLLLAQNVQPKAGTPGVAQDSTPPANAAGGAQAPSSSPLAGISPILLMLVVFVPIFLMMNRRQKKESQARSALKKGDRVMTNAGLIGELVEMDDRIAKVKISPSVTVQIVASTVSPYVDASKPSSTKELNEAKALSDKK